MEPSGSSCTSSEDQLSVSVLHQDPVPGLGVVLEDLHDGLTSLDDHGGVPVERVR